MNVRDLSLTSILAALYAALVYLLAGISFQVVQVRVADALIPLSIIYGWPVVIGVTIGCAAANVISPMPSIVIDIAFGSIANLLASLTAWKISERGGKKEISDFAGCLAAATLITFIVGSYLAWLTQTNPIVWWIGVGIGSFISVNILGYTLVQSIRKIHGK